MSDIVEIEAFRRNNVGKKVHYKVRVLGSNDAWKTCEGVLTDSGVKIYESGYDVFYDFPNEEFEYSSIRAVAEDGSPSYLHPSPATSRVQSRAASMERATIHHGVQGVQQGVQQAADEGRAERLAIANPIAEMRESSAAERRLLLEEQRAAAAAAAANQARVEAILLQLAEATRFLQAAATGSNPQQQATPAQQATAPQQKDEEQTTIGRRLELDIFFPQKWDLSKPEAVQLKRAQVMQFFAITSKSSPQRWRAFNQLSSWMDSAFEVPVWSEAFANIGVTAMENLRAQVAYEDNNVNSRALFDATANLPSDKMGDAISALAKEAAKQQRGRSRGRGGYGHGAQSNNNNQRQRGPAQQ